MIHMYIYKDVCHRHIGISFYIYKIYFDTYIYIQYNRIFIFYAHHTTLRSHFADNGHTFVAKRQVHSRHCGQDNTDRQTDILLTKIKVITYLFVIFVYTRMLVC